MPQTDQSDVAQVDHNVPRNISRSPPRLEMDRDARQRLRARPWYIRSLSIYAPSTGTRHSVSRAGRVTLIECGLSADGTRARSHLGERCPSYYATFATCCSSSLVGCGRTGMRTS
ncbi:hypothetical protein DACRYDRAFT_20235 [Dacryopinax primogenitus]|uniref:Uncharacterized protein n=1 Tax=Dacryopinax primogenitus (strain DJM 731) TaxID=1858805 RepID=M5G6N3_DACPD|nr:uncharacterized protein DACRYDRAFT_20235 [Dacryopinax primogenitus]EJU05911.1 hypothetical protein DACRYDRAFT_20235 [Dacryopinax primogenitus]